MANYDESLAGDHPLPDPLLFADGSPVRNAEEWRTRRRPELIALFASEVYGKTPPAAAAMRIRPEAATAAAAAATAGTSSFETAESARGALGGIAVRKQISIVCRTPSGEADVNLLIYLPAAAAGSAVGGPVPLFAGLNFFGNHTVHADPAILPGGDADKPRAHKAHRWPIERIIGRGYGVATAWCGDMDPDFDDGFKNGLHPLFYRPGQAAPAPDEWGTIGAWAWGLSRMMDYFEADPEIDAARVAVMGHSRLGKTALWAGVQDERFALVVSNASGCGGAALSRRNFGETVDVINEKFPHWFCGNFKKYGADPTALPVDQHELIACVAPRPVYVASASEDLWADPRGEFLSALNASPVYGLFGAAGLVAADGGGAAGLAGADGGTVGPAGGGGAPVEMPEIHQPLHGGRIGYHIRSGVHEVTEYDWDRFMDFADLRMGEGARH